MGNERFLFVMNIIAPSVSFLFLRNSSFIPSLYVIQQLTQQLALYSVTISAGTPFNIFINLFKTTNLPYCLVLPELCKKSKCFLPMLAILSLAFFAVRCVLEAFEVLLNFDIGNLFIFRASQIVFFFAWVAFMVCIMTWCYLTWKSMYKHCKYEISHDAYQGLVYFSIYIIVYFLVVVVNIHFKATTWQNVNEACLVSYVYITLVSSVFFSGHFYYCCHN